MRVDVVKEADGSFSLTIYFHWIKRFGEMLKLDAQKEHVKQLKIEKDAKEEAEKEAQRKAIVEHVRRMI